MSKWRETTDVNEVFEALDAGLEAQTFFGEPVDNYFDVHTDGHKLIGDDSSHELEIVRNRKYRIEVKPKEFKIVIPEDKELAKRMAESCEKMRKREMKCSGVMCDDCPGTLTFNNGVECHKNAWREGRTNAQRWLEAYHAQLQPQYERIERGSMSLFNGSPLQWWIGTGRLVGYFYKQKPDSMYTDYPIVFDRYGSNGGMATHEQLESGERIPGDLIAIKVRSET